MSPRQKALDAVDHALTLMRDIDSADLQPLREVREFLLEEEKGEVYLILIHGRSDPDENMDDWGANGPVLGPFDYVHTTYAADVKVTGSVGADGKEFEDSLYIINNLLYYDGVYYGDWSVTSKLGLDDDQSPAAFDSTKTKPAGKQKYSTNDGNHFSWNNTGTDPTPTAGSAGPASIVPVDVWSEDGRYSREDWKYEVSNGDTNLGYWEWVISCRERDTDDEQLQAQHEGWDIFDADGSDDGRWQLQAIAAPTDHPHLDYKEPKFPGDTEAAAHVLAKAKEGSVLHRRAIQFLVSVGSRDVAEFKLTDGIVKCEHKKTHFVDAEDEPGLGSIEVCDDCGMSRRHWEQGESSWLLVPLK
jgi:hypothetical protein